MKIRLLCVIQFILFYYEKISSSQYRLKAIQHATLIKPLFFQRGRAESQRESLNTVESAHLLNLLQMICGYVIRLLLS